MPRVKFKRLKVTTQMFFSDKLDIKVDNSDSCESQAGSRWMVLITLDFKNSFNTAMSSKIKKELQRRQISGYLITIIRRLSNKKLIVSKKEHNRSPTTWHSIRPHTLECTLQRNTENTPSRRSYVLRIHR